MFAITYEMRHHERYPNLSYGVIGRALHMAVEIVLDARWLASEGLPPHHGEELLKLLDALSRASSLREAAATLGISYRHAWGLVGTGARTLGSPLVEMQRGRGARLTPFGRRLLEVDAHVHTALDPQFERLRREARAMLAGAVSGRRRRVTVRASHDLALPLLVTACAPRIELDLSFHGADECLAALARGECDLAGFHVADALPRAAAAAAAVGRWLDPRKHQLVHFVAREQGIIVRPGARIRGVHDLARPGVRFLNRPASGRPHEDVDLAVASAVSEGRADAGFGLRAAAARYTLEFVPLATERYYLVAARRALREPPLQALLTALRSAEFRSAVAGLPGYDATQAGTRETLTAALAWLERRRTPSPD